MNTRRIYPRIIVAALGATLLAACGDIDSPTAPRSQLQPQSIRVQRPSFDISGMQVPLTTDNDTTYATFTVSPTEAKTFVFNRHNAISFPAGAICDPATSSYGPTEWDQPCQPIATEQTFAVKVFAGPDGHTRVDFTPAVRFNPAAESVVLYLEDNDNGVPLWFKDIYYCHDGGECIDESASDPTLRTYYDEERGILGRRVKHFSLYQIGVGFSRVSADLY